MLTQVPVKATFGLCQSMGLALIVLCILRARVCARVCVYVCTCVSMVSLAPGHACRPKSISHSHDTGTGETWEGNLLCPRAYWIPQLP